MASLEDWLILLAEQLDEALGLRFQGSSGSWVMLGRPGDGEQAGTRIVLTLAALHPAQPSRNLPPRRNTRNPAPAPPLTLDGHLLMTARPTDAGYAESLRILSAAMEWFNAHPRLSGAGNAGFSGGEGTVAIEQVDLPLDRMAELIEAYATQGMPCTVYRLRGMAIGA